MKYNCIYIGEIEETIEEEKKLYSCLYDTSEKKLYKLDKRFHVMPLDEKDRPFKDWLRDNWLWIAFCILGFFLLVTKVRNNLAGYAGILIADLVLIFYFRRRAISKRCREFEKIKETVSGESISLEKLKRIYSDNKNCRDYMLISLTLFYVLPFMLLFVLLKDHNSEWIAAWPLLAYRRYDRYIDFLPRNIYHLYLTLCKKDDTAISSMLVSSVPLLAFLLSTIGFKVNSRSIFSAILSYLYPVSPLIAVEGLILSIRAKKEGKKLATLSIVLSLITVLVALYLAYAFYIALLLYSDYRGNMPN